MKNKNNNKQNNKNNIKMTSGPQRTIAVRQIPISYGVKTSNSIGQPRTISGREFLAEVKGLGDEGIYEVRSYAINPGISDHFPNLSSITSHYDEYQFSSLKFVFHPSAPTTMGGLLYQAFEPNPSRPMPLTERDINSMECCVSTPFYSSSNVLTIPFSALGKWRRTRRYAVSDDLNNYDVGRFVYAMSGLTGYETVGRIEVIYNIKVRGCQPFDTLQYSPRVFASAQAGVDRPISLTASTMKWLSPNIVNTQGIINAPDGISLPPGNYKITVTGRITRPSQTVTSWVNITYDLVDDTNDFDLTTTRINDLGYASNFTSVLSINVPEHMVFRMRYAGDWNTPTSGFATIQDANVIVEVV
nr:MAG: hypothetical protein 3 [Tombusviridae sp.]